MQTPSRRAFLATASALGASAVLQVGDAREAVSLSGIVQPALAELDTMMTTFLQEQRVAGASLAVTHHSKLVYLRGFGLADRQARHAVQPADLFRIASISKLLTAVAVLQLAERGKLALDGAVWPLLSLAEPADARWKRVTLWHLLHHTGGWDDQAFSPMFQTAMIAKALNAPLPLQPDQIIRHMLSQPLRFEPGERFAYTNFGYCLLGRAIERAGGTSYEQYVQREVLAPLGIRRMRLGKTLASQRAAGEVAYYDERNRTAPAVVGPVAEHVPLPYGTWPLEAMDASGGWLASAADLARFACAFDDPGACPILQRTSVAAMWARPEGTAGVESGGNYPGCGWFVWPGDSHAHRAAASSNGLLAGTSTYLMRRHDGVNWAVLFNVANAPDGKPLMLKFRDASSGAFERVAEWPEKDQFPAQL